MPQPATDRAMRRNASLEQRRDIAVHGSAAAHRLDKVRSGGLEKHSLQVQMRATKHSLSRELQVPSYFEKQEIRKNFHMNVY